MQPQFSTSMPRAITEAAAPMNTTRQDRDDRGRLALPETRDQQHAGDGLDPGQEHGHEVRADGSEHLPLVDDLGEGGGVRDLVEARLEEEGAQGHAEDEVHASGSGRSSGLAPLLGGDSRRPSRPASLRSGSRPGSPSRAASRGHDVAGLAAVAGAVDHDVEGASAAAARGSRRPCRSRARAGRGRPGCGSSCRNPRAGRRGRARPCRGGSWPRRPR